MGQESPVQLVHASSWQEAAPILPEFVRAHVSRFQATGRTSNLTRPERRLFLEELTKLLSVPGWFVLTRMMAGERALAWNYGFQFDGTWFWYQPTFDTDLERHSPGFCLLTKLIEEAASSPSFKLVDLGLGAEEYKERFANQTRKTLYVTLKTSMAKHVKEIVRYRTPRSSRRLPGWKQVREKWSQGYGNSGKVQRADLIISPYFNNQKAFRLFHRKCSSEIRTCFGARRSAL